MSTSIAGADNYQLLAGHAIFLPLLWFAVRADLRRVVLRLAVIGPFVLVAAVLISLMDLGGPKTEMISGPFGIAVSARAVGLFLEVITKAGIAVTALALVAAGYGAQGILNGLAALRFPRTILLLMGHIFRFGSLAAGSALAMERARVARAGKRGGGGRLGFWAAGSGLGSLLTRSLARAERVQRAMLARGFDGSLPLLSVSPLRVGDFVFVGFAIACIGALRLMVG